MDVSDLTFIGNPPESPIQLFDKWHDEARQNTDPNLFLDVMAIASRDE